MNPVCGFGHDHPGGEGLDDCETALADLKEVGTEIAMTLGFPWASEAGHLPVSTVSYACVWCRRRTYNPNDVRERYCSCCGSADGLLFKDCLHRRP